MDVFFFQLIFIGAIIFLIVMIKRESGRREINTMEIQLTFHEDPGHGWLEVPGTLLQELKIEGDISTYSYFNDGQVYLEEDCDAAVFLSAARSAGYTLDISDNYQDDTPIRNYSSFHPHQLFGDSSPDQGKLL